MKSCSRCEERKELSEFYRQKQNPTGYTPHCKACHKLAYPDKLWNKTQKGKASAKVATKAWHTRNKEKCRAHRILGYNLKLGRIVRPEECSQCGAVARLDGHHEDHSKPLDVEWLCRGCHKQVHMGTHRPE